MMKKSEIYGAAGSFLFNGILILLLFLFGLSIDKSEKTEDGIEINFGDGMDGAPAQEVAEVQPTSAAPEAVSVPTPPVQSSSVPSIAQEDPSIAIAAEKKRNEERERREQIRQEQAKIAAENARIKAERARIAAEQKAAADRAAKAAKANALAAGAFGGGGSSASGSGVGGGGTGSTPGNPIGRGSSGGNTWSLTGRSMRGNFYKPTYVGSQEGRVIVSITVNKNGDVISASIKQGTTISEEGLRDECKAAARKIKFTPNPKAVGNAIGEIVYNFRQQ